MFEIKSLAAEYFSESGTAGIAPFGFVITQRYIVFYFQQVKAWFYFLHGRTVTFFGKVACYQYEIKAVGCVDLGDRP